MRILRKLDDLADFLSHVELHPGCFADSGFLYALAYADDQYFERANSVLDLLSDARVSVYANVISRMEFIDLIFRKQVTLGCLKLFGSLGPESFNTALFRLLKNIRDQNTSVSRIGQSFKIGEKQLKELRHELNEYGDESDWFVFCSEYVGSMLQTEWRMLEDDFDLRFIEVLEGQTNDLFGQAVKWSDMVDIMGERGLRGPDAMIVNLFAKSKLPLLITADGDFEKSLYGIPQVDNKAIFVL